MQVKECMCQNVCYCKPDTKVSDVAKMMNENHIGCIPVCDDNNFVVGILTDRDITLRTIGCDKDCSCTNASEVMSTETTCCDCNENIDMVVKHMGEKGIRRIPVTQDGKLVGMLTLGDLAKHKNVSCNCVGDTLENICNCNNNKV